MSGTLTLDTGLVNTAKKSDESDKANNDASSDSKKPNPTFFSRKSEEQKKPMGLPIAPRAAITDRQAPDQRLSRAELESLLDHYYKNTEPQRGGEPDADHASKGGYRLVRNLAMVTSFALLFGFGVGLYTLWQSGGETSLGKNLNMVISSIWKPAAASDSQALKSKAAKAWTNSQGAVVKPIKTASLVVANAQGAIQAGIPLQLSIKSDTDASLLAVKIMNVPADAVLTAGKRQDDGVWVLRPADLDNVALVLSSDRSEPLHLQVELVEVKTGELLSPSREIRVAIVAPKPFKVGEL